ncbi:nephrocystin-1 [Anguilla rostrata]|uniref:nephrocystin-1 n=1 Tax=Anguilla rostrata TaxID=7938 RepID=UPI0030D1409D
MAPKRKGPLQTVQRNTDDIKKQVDSLMLEVRQFKGSAESKAMTEASERCTHLQRSVDETMMTLKKLTKADEPAPVGNYEQRKLDEENRLKMMQEQLQALALAVSPAQKPGPSRNADVPSSSQTEEDDDAGAESEEEESEEEEDEDEEDDDEEEDLENQAETFIAISAFAGEQEGDLTVQKGELLSILSKNPDGWWLAQDSSGNKGLVPKTYLKAHQDEEEEGDAEDSETEEESEEEVDEVSKTKQSSQKSAWDVVRKEVLEMNATDVLAAMGAIPAGFRPSTLSSLLSEGNTYRGSYYLQPELSQSQLAFKDLFWDPDTGNVRPRPSRTSLTLTLWSCRMIPTPGVGVQVLSRHVRLCVFDGAKVLSNIHTVRACYNSKNPKTWTFSPRMVGILPSLMDGDCFVRSDSQSPDLGILFELGVTYIRNSTGERGDLSCGWAFLRLCDASGVPVPRRTYELPVHGGTPYEQGVDVDPSITRRATGSVLQQMMVSRKLPKLIVKLKSPNAKTRANLNLLPDTLVGSRCSVQLLALYRQVLADALLRDRLTMQNADLICSPVLATFPQVLHQTDLLDALRSAWAERESGLKRSQKRDTQLLKGLFVEVYLETVFPLLHSAGLPPARWADEEQETQRASVVFARPPQGALATLLSADHAQEAFDIAQLAYDFLSPTRAAPPTN